MRRCNAPCARFLLTDGVYEACAAEEDAGAAVLVLRPLVDACQEVEQDQECEETAEEMLTLIGQACGCEGDGCHWATLDPTRQTETDIPDPVCADDSEHHAVRCCSDTAIDSWREVTCDGASVWTGMVVLSSITIVLYLHHSVPVWFQRMAVAILKASSCVLSLESDAAGFNGCQSSATHVEADQICESLGGRLCSKTEVDSGCIRGTGCSFDVALVWTSDSSSIPGGRDSACDIGNRATRDYFWLMYLQSCICVGVASQTLIVRSL
eukprot:SAG11_NODE_1170_length_5614_cov_4.941795_5_plen_267_part_00